MTADFDETSHRESRSVARDRTKGVKAGVLGNPGISDIENSSKAEHQVNKASLSLDADALNA